MLTPEVLEARRQGIGGSDIAAILGVNPYSAAIDVYLDKLNLAAPWEGNEKTHWGDLLEPVIAAEYTKRTGVETARVDQIIRHRQHPWMLANPDRVLVGHQRGLEIKTAGIRSEHRWGTGEEDVPEEYLMQCAWYMAVLDFDLWDLAVLIGGQEMRIYTLERDPELEELMIERARVFWFDNVLARVPPPVDGSESFARYLAEKYPRDRRPMRRASEVEAFQMRELRAVRGEIEEATVRGNLLTNQLKSTMEDVGGIFSPDDDLRIIWKATVKGTRPFRPNF